VYGDAAIRPKCTWYPKNAVFTQNFAMSMTPEWKVKVRLVSLFVGSQEKVMEFENS